MISPLLFLALLETAAAAPSPATPAPAQPTAVVAAKPAEPQLSYNQFHINTKAVALTFDDGPHPKNTPRLLDMLKERGIKATFFLIGKNVVTHPEIVRRIAQEGHEVANHTWDHKMLRAMGPEKINEELQKTHDAIVAACGTAPLLYRPPFGAINTKQKKAIMEKFNYPAIVWEIDPEDWKSPRSIAKVHDKILADAHAGSIILCHDVHVETVDAMPTTLDELKAKGFQFLTVSQMIKLEADEISGAVKATPTPAPAPAPVAPAVETTKPAKTEAPAAAK